MCALGSGSKLGSSVGARMLVRSDVGQPLPKRFVPHTEQKVFALPSSGWYVRTRSAPSMILSDAVGTPTFAVPAPPESRLQVVQWQNRNGSGSASASNRTPPQRQLPRITV